jgi:YVTN family beta-propeller protein
MRLTRLVAGSVLLVVSLASCQWLDETLYLPDSFGGIYGPQCLAYSAANNTIYVGGPYSDCVIAIDGASNQKVARIPTCLNVSALCCNSQDDKVYCASYIRNQVTVIDGATNRVVAAVPAGDQPRALCYNPTDNKLYCANGYYCNDKTVTAIDCGTQTPVATITLPVSPSALAYDSVADRLYCLSSSDYYAAVVDCQRDTMATLVRVGNQPVAAVHATQFRRMYVANEYGSSLSVIRDTARSGIEGSCKPQATRNKPVPTVVRGVLFLGDCPRTGTVPKTVLLDISGRKVLDLHAGANNVSRPAPGVYFVREQSQAASPRPQAIRKTLVTR